MKAVSNIHGLYPDQQEAAYQNSLTDRERERFNHLLLQTPEVVRTDLVCADCGAALTLRLGRYGRFYGCTTYETAGCKGGISAHNDGTPKGWPGNAATRAARKRLVERFNGNSLYEPLAGESWMTKPGHRQRYVTVCEVLGMKPGDPFKIAELDQEQCEKAIEALDIMNVPQMTRWDHLRLYFLLPAD